MVRRQSEQMQNGHSRRGFAGSQDRTVFVDLCTVYNATPTLLLRNKTDKM